MAENTLVSIECDIEQCTKQRDRLIWQVQALDEQLRDLNNERRDLQLEAVGLKYGDKLMVTEDVPFFGIKKGVFASVRYCKSSDGQIICVYYCGRKYLPLATVRRWRQAYLDSVAATD